MLYFIYGSAVNILPIILFCRCNLANVHACQAFLESVWYQCLYITMQLNGMGKHFRFEREQTHILQPKYIHSIKQVLCQSLALIANLTVIHCTACLQILHVTCWKLKRKWKASNHHEIEPTTELPQPDNHQPSLIGTAQVVLKCTPGSHSICGVDQKILSI